jgi:hypothetical protein
MTRGADLAILLALAVWCVACGRPLTNQKDGGAGGGAIGGAGGAGIGGGAGTGGAVGGGTGASGAGGASGGGAGTGADCHCTDGRCCGPDQLCEIPTGACLAGATLGGTCMSRPGLCSELIQLVCGCDDMTYSSDCYRQMAGVPKQADGACVCPPLPPAGACTTPGKVCPYGLNSNPSCKVQVTCDPTTRQWAASPPVCL